jgi:DNA-binding NarL/FixJ family response regulator
LARAALASLLHDRANIPRVHEAAGQSEMLTLMDEVQPQFLLVNAEFGQRTIQSAIDRARKTSSCTRIVVLAEGIARGAIFHLVKRSNHALVDWSTSPEDLLRVMRRHRSMLVGSVISRTTGDAHHLTPRELEVVELVAAGMSNSDIGVALAISGATVKRHLASIFIRLNAHSRVQAINNATEAGYLSETK